MNKKIIAVILALIVMAVGFTACKRDERKTIKVRGKQYIPATNEAGEYIVNGKDMAVCVTKENGKVEKDKDGNEATVYIEMPVELLNKNQYETADLKFVAPKEWKLKDEESGKPVYVLTENEKQSFEVSSPSPISEKSTFDSYVQIQKDSMDMVNNNPNEFKIKINYQVNEKEPMGERKLRCSEIKMSIEDLNGNKTGEQILLFVQNGEMLMRFSYVCEDTSKLDSFNVYDFVKSNVYFKEVK